MSAGLACVFDEPPITEYEQGVRDGIESAVRRFTALRRNPSSMHVRAASPTVPLTTSYIRMDHIDEVLAELSTAAVAVTDGQ